MALGQSLRCLASANHSAFRLLFGTVKRTYYDLPDMSELDKKVYFIKENDTNSGMVWMKYEDPKCSFKNPIILVQNLNLPVSQLYHRLSLKLAKKYSVQVKKKQKKGETLVMPEIQSQIYVGDQALPMTTTLEDIFSLEGDIKLQITDNFYSIVINPPWVSNIVLPDVVTVGMRVYPLQIQSTNMDKDKSIFKWYRSVAKFQPQHQNLDEWLEIGQDYVYEVVKEDVGSFIKVCCTPGNDNSTGPTFCKTVNSVVENYSTDYFFFETHTLTSEEPVQDVIRVVTYNILADLYTNTKEGKVYFKYCLRSSLVKPVRFSAICKELIGYKADLICLQEVEGNVFKNYLLFNLEPLGYSGFINHKTTDREGTAIFFKKSKFRLLTTKNYVFGNVYTMNTFPEINKCLDSDVELYRKFIALPHSLQLVVLKSLVQEDQIIVVGNVHFYSIQQAELIRLLQGIISVMLYANLKNQLSEQWGTKNISLIWCGDFNSLPESPIHEFIKNQSITEDHEVWKYFKDENNCFSFNHNLKLDSAAGTPNYTNYTNLFKGCLDYIYYETDFLTFEKLYPLPKEEEVRAEVGLPSSKFPSDHIPLIVDLKWKS